MKKKKMNAKGFTMIEMAVVLFIISALMLLTVPNVSNQKANADSKGKEALMTVIQTQIDLYELDGGVPETVTFDILKTQGYLNASQAKQAGEKLVIEQGIVKEKTAATP